MRYNSGSEYCKESVLSLGPRFQRTPEEATLVQQLQACQTKVQQLICDVDAETDPTRRAHLENELAQMRAAQSRLLTSLETISPPKHRPISDESTGRGSTPAN